MKIIIILAGVFLATFVSVFGSHAQQAPIFINSQAERQAPRIILRSPFDFEKNISLKLRPDPRFIPSDVLIKAVSKMGMSDARGVRITSGFDIDVENDLVLGLSGGSAQIIKASSSAAGLNITASFKDGSGNFISPPQESLALYTTYGEQLCFDYKDVKRAEPKMAFILLLDRSGSMGEVISEVQSSAQSFLQDLPPSAECAVVSFNGSFSYHNKYFQSCNTGDFKLADLSAEGGTRLYAPLLGAYDSLSRDAFNGYQKAVIIITDGQVAPDEEMKRKLLAAKKDSLTFVYFLGDKNEHPLIGLADAFLQASTELKANLQNYFHSLSTAYGAQKVLNVSRCTGGH